MLKHDTIKTYYSSLEYFKNLWQRRSELKLKSALKHPLRSHRLKKKLARTIPETPRSDLFAKNQLLK